MEDFTFTITPSDQEKFLNALAEKIALKAVSEEVISALVVEVADNIDYSELSETVLSEIDYDEIGRDLIQGLDYRDIASEVSDHIDIRDLARDVVSEISPEDLIQETNIDRLIEENVEQAVLSTVNDFLSEASDRIDELENAVEDLNDQLIFIGKQIKAIQDTPSKNLFQRIFGL
jgi:hypothetical protein